MLPHSARAHGHDLDYWCGKDVTLFSEEATETATVFVSTDKDSPGIIFSPRDAMAEETLAAVGAGYKYVLLSRFSSPEAHSQKRSQSLLTFFG